MGAPYSMMPVRDRSSLSTVLPPRISEAAFLALCPIVAFWAMRFTPIAQAGFLDPYIYTGYINNFDDLFQRFGTTYYGVRFGLIGPAQLLTALFGPVTGFFALRYALVLLAGIPFYIVVKQRFGVALAVAMLCVLFTSPYLARAVLWDHPDAAGVPFSFAAICLFLIEHRQRWVLDLLAGACAGMAIHSNVFVAAPLTIFVAAYATLWVFWHRRISTMLQRLLVLLAGFALVTAVASAYYWWRVELTDIFSVTFAVSRGLINGGMAAWRTPGVRWMAGQWAVLTPVFLLISGLLVWLRRSPTFNDAVIVISGAGVTAFFYVVQFLMNGNSLELFYYFSYLLPFVFLMTALILGTLWTDATPQTRATAVTLFVSTAIGAWALRTVGARLGFPVSLSFRQHLFILGTSLVVVLLWRCVPRYRQLTMLGATATLGLALFSSFATPMYVSMINSPPHRVRETDVYRVAIQLIASAPRASQNPGSMKFWYSNRPLGNAMQSIQSTYLWGYSKIQGQGLGMPYLEGREGDSLRDAGLKWLVLLAEKNDDLASGLAAVRQTGITHKVVERRVFNTDTYTLHFELLELSHDQTGQPAPASP